MVYLLSYLLVPSGLHTLALEALMHFNVDSSKHMTFNQS
jgi:hypothetical protein